MSTTVLLTITEGKYKGESFAFHNRQVLTVGRSSDCHFRLPSDEEHHTVSRHHCLLKIDPPAVRVRDLGSLNGTHVNGRDIGHRDKELTAEEVVGMDWPEYQLVPGDELRVGDTVFQVDVVPDEDRINSGEPQVHQAGRDEVVSDDRECDVCW